jgi:hypothetical protein
LESDSCDLDWETESRCFEEIRTGGGQGSGFLFLSDADRNGAN